MPTAPAIPGGGQFLDLADARLSYEEQGAGDPLLLLHGGFQSGAIWAAMVPLLARHFRVIVPDSRGHGHSTNPPGHLTYEQLADDAVALTTALHLERPAVVGWSDGGQVALEIGLRHPDAAHALVAAGAFFDFGEGFKGSVREIFGVDGEGTIDVARTEGAFGPMLPHLRAMQVGDDAAWHDLLQQTVAMWLAYGGLSEADFRRIETPALVVVGDRDPFVPVEVGAAMYRMLPSAQLAVCPNAGHGLPETHPAWFAQTVVDVLNAQDTATT